MRVAILFFTCLCFLLPGGDRGLAAGTCQSGNSYSSAQSIRKLKQPEFINASQLYSVISDINLQKEQGYLITDDVEEDDSNDVFARRYKLLGLYFLTLACLVVLSYLCGRRSKASRPFFGLLSDKYITQRVLRI